jgi:hypothetical protein
VDERAMICPNCSRSNPPDAAFCTQCGTALGVDDRALSSRGTWAPSSHTKPGWQTYDNIPVSPLARKVGLVLVGVLLVGGVFFFARIGGAPSSVLAPIYNVGDGTCVHKPSPRATSGTHSWTCRHGHWIAQH